MILLQRKNQFLCTLLIHDGTSDLSGDNYESEEVVVGGHTRYPAEIVSRGGIPSEEQFLFRLHINEIVIQ